MIKQICQQWSFHSKFVSWVEGMKNLLQTKKSLDTNENLFLTK